MSSDGRTWRCRVQVEDLPQLKFAYVDSSRNSHDHGMDSSSKGPQNGIRDPSKLFYQQDITRRYIISAYWFIIVLALPLWWSTTSIERLSLPSSRVTSQARSHLRIPIRLNIDAEHNGHLLATSLTESMEGLIARSQDRWKGLNIYINQRQSNGTSVLKWKEHVE
jgi:hypothetical protein